ncbi:SdrD B-like domain-containing protein [Staphylococcus delphini]|uniref:Fibrinogen-binding adhesin SdrG C-terminal domain-containing protein n=1 Tax=Staphylococcus delphini TaxID=53344 RepID=A0AAQ0D5G9_9STAP|nr:SdrD B-like domain-containing protein [Staphylococcus delphini]QUM65979.1 fibrinogen-binding adhesin SdrG C-terminal domain-containing protein [Staphylococcus delphini]QUM68413.1 fibrinogen-binding adhesin SdrG C-terminal domain-containing protein [Staphylococcus delphini]
MITNKNIYSIRKHKLGVASFLLGTLFIVGQAHDADASEVSSTTQAQNVEKEQMKTEGEGASDVVEQAVVEPTPVAENTQEETPAVTEVTKEATPVSSENAKEITAPKSTQEVTKTEVKVTEIAQPVSEANKPVTQTAPVQAPTTGKQQTSPRQAQEVTAPVDTKVVHVEKGTDVTSKVKVEKSSITGHQNNDKTYRQSNTINPHKAERVTLNYEWIFDKDIKNDDYFEFQLSDNVDTHGISTVKKVPNIVDTQNNDTVIAFGEINEQNRVRYRFTDYVSKKDNVKGNLSLNLFIDPAKVLNNGNTNVSSILNGTKTESTFNIEYIDGVHNAAGVTLNGRLVELSKAKQTFTHFATFKPKHNKLSSVTITGKVKNGVLQNSNNGEVKVYEFIGNGELPQSVYANVNDTSQFKDITNTMNSTKSNGAGYEITFDMTNDKPYVIVYKGNFDSNSKDFDFTTNANGYQNLNQSQYSYYWPYNYSFNLTWDNGVAFYSNKANGEGNDKPVPPTYGFSPTVETSQNTVTYSPVMTFQQTGVLEEIEDSAVLNILSQSGEDRGENTSPVIETTEDTQPVDFEETTTFPPTNHANEMIEFEEDTNYGEQDTVHHSDVVEYDEDTTTGMLTGAISDHTTEEDTMEYTTDGLLIEFDDEMNPNVSGQYDDIAMDTIDESSQIDTFTELESEFGQHDDTMTFEEDTIVEKPKTEKGNRVPLVIDLSTPKNNHKFNIQPEAPATYQIGDFVWRDEDHNGVQNDGERGLEGVFVTLKTPEGKILLITTTDETGHYRFSNVEKGKYVVEFQTPKGYEATSQHTTADTAKDSDGLIAHIDVTEDDMTIDAGFFPLENWNPKQQDETYTIGDFVWRDEDHNGVQNEGERGLEGVIITLKTADGTVVGTTTSDENGHYQFTNVQKGKYIVEFAVPEGYEATSQHTTADTTKDSDGLIAHIDVTQDDMTIDAGFFPLENWNPQPEPKDPKENEQPEPMKSDEMEKPEPKQPDAPQPEPMKPGEMEKPEPKQPDIPQPEPMNPEERERPEPKQPDAPQPEPMNPGEKEMPKGMQPGERKPSQPSTMPQHESTEKGHSKMTASEQSSTTDEVLPETGESSSQSSALIFGGLLSLLGLGLLRRSSKQNRSSMK